MVDDIKEETNLVRKWYVVHTHSGHEKKIKADLERKLENDSFLQSKVFNVLLPEEEVVEIKRGKRQKVLKKLFTGYLIIETEVEEFIRKDGISYRIDSDVWYTIRNTSGVTGFVGVSNEPVPLDDDEARRLGIKLESINSNEETKIDFHHNVGDLVTINLGAFAGSTGKLFEIDSKHNRVKVEIEVFGRKTPIVVKMEEIGI